MRFTTLRCGCSAHIYPDELRSTRLYNIHHCKVHTERVGNFERRRRGHPGLERFADVVAYLLAHRS